MKRGLLFPGEARDELLFVWRLILEWGEGWGMLVRRRLVTPRQRGGGASASASSTSNHHLTTIHRPRTASASVGKGGELKGCRMLPPPPASMALSRGWVVGRGFRKGEGERDREGFVIRPPLFRLLRPTSFSAAGEATEGDRFARGEKVGERREVRTSSLSRSQVRLRPPLLLSGGGGAAVVWRASVGGGGRGATSKNALSLSLPYFPEGRAGGGPRRRPDGRTDGRTQRGLSPPSFSYPSFGARAAFRSPISR